MIHIIYGIIDPCNCQIRYVGKTFWKKNKSIDASLSDRLKGHVKGINRSTHVACWLRSLIEQNLYPDIFLIEVVKDYEDWREVERFWISYFRSIGARLTNLTSGGDGIDGYKFSEEARKKNGEYHKGSQNYWYGVGPMYGRNHTEESRRRIGLYWRGRKRVRSGVERTVAFHRGRKRSQITKDRLSVAWEHKDKPEISAKLREAWKKRPRIWITDGIESRFIFESIPIPDGWRRGRTRAPRTI